MKEKLLQFMKSEGLTSSRLAEILEIQPSGISHILAGRNKPGFDLLQKILRRFPRINPDWLLLDSEQMYRDLQIAGMQTGVTGTDELFDGLSSTSGTTGAGPVPISPQPLEVPTQIGIPEVNAEMHSEQPGGTSIVRVVVFYADHTCESFSSKN